MPRLNVLHVITHLAIGGATKIMLTICRDSDPGEWNMAILAGQTFDELGALDSEADRLGLTRHTLTSLRRPIDPVADYQAYRDLVAWIRRGNWDIVHTHGSKAGILARLAASAAGVPVIIHTVHGWGHHNRQNPLVRGMFVTAERKVARVTDRLIVVADAGRETGLQDRIGHSGQYRKIAAGIDIERYRDVDVDTAALRATLGIPQNAPVVGTVSRMAEQKAPDDFIKMAAHVHRQRPNAHFVFAGGGPMEHAIAAMTREMGLNDVVHLLGFRNDIPQLLRVFDIFVLNSLWEGLPTVFAQAMCARLPIVATQVDGAPEAVLPGKNGILVPPGQPEYHAREVLALIENEALRKSMGQCGSEMVYPKFCERDMVRQIHEVYRHCAGEKGLAVSGPDELEAIQAVK